MCARKPSFYKYSPAEPSMMIHALPIGTCLEVVFLAALANNGGGTSSLKMWVSTHRWRLWLINERQYGDRRGPAAADTDPAKCNHHGGATMGVTRQRTVSIMWRWIKGPLQFIRPACRTVERLWAPGWEVRWIKRGCVLAFTCLLILTLPFIPPAHYSSSSLNFCVRFVLPLNFAVPSLFST